MSRYHSPGRDRGYTTSVNDYERRDSTSPGRSRAYTTAAGGGDDYSRLVQQLEILEQENDRYLKKAEKQARQIAAVEKKSGNQDFGAPLPVSPSRVVEGATPEKAPVYDLHQGGSLKREITMAPDCVKQLLWMVWVIAVKKHVEKKDVKISSQIFKWFYTLVSMGTLALQWWIANKLNHQQDVSVAKIENSTTKTMPTISAHFIALLMLTFKAFTQFYNTLVAIRYARQAFFHMSSQNLWTLCVFIMVIAQMFISGYLLLASYKLIIQQGDVLRVMKSYAGLFFANEFAEVVGAFFKPFFKDYGETFMAFREADFAHSDVSKVVKVLARMSRGFLVVNTSMWAATLIAMTLAYYTKHHIQGVTQTSQMWTVGILLGVMVCSWWLAVKYLANCFLKPHFVTSEEADSDEEDEQGAADEGDFGVLQREGGNKLTDADDDDFLRYN